ncbi:hypothetical protein E2C01_088147 [Portunus trituberculatus]|uniref:Uncharacterized protein n=1 Tax=Portunus trituberculatus TaxID=210409 RepID=A0A5B7J5C7_PORTR|nr:hypothetical protein [Portunus trituberculatus]
MQEELFKWLKDLGRCHLRAKLMTPVVRRCPVLSLTEGEIEAMFPDSFCYHILADLWTRWNCGRRM